MSALASDGGGGGGRSEMILCYSGPVMAEDKNYMQTREYSYSNSSKTLICFRIVKIRNQSIHTGIRVLGRSIRIRRIL